MAVSTNVYAVLSDTASAAQSHIVVHTKSRLAERTTPTALALTDFSKSVFAVSFGNLDLGANHVGGDMSWTPLEIDAGIETYESYLATDAASSGGALAGSMAVSVTPSRSGHRALPSDMCVTSQLASHAGLPAPSRASSRVPASPLGGTSSILQKWRLGPPVADGISLRKGSGAVAQPFYELKNLRFPFFPV